jgi:hypothetical protein
VFDLIHVILQLAGMADNPHPAHAKLAQLLGRGAMAASSAQLVGRLIRTEIWGAEQRGGLAVPFAVHRALSASPVISPPNHNLYAGVAPCEVEDPSQVMLYHVFTHA